ncbi:unnamed protein product [Fraxinus pennsylvanica]|uniref:DUF7032 domain-containing protein n=1 Tax=Fraxinus pennsylvanica TaxID=56036 RepID=A0AAD2DQ89_9LAMI|nr:unnamed protein product [Fraxinus pennsylvanica]
MHSITTPPPQSPSEPPSPAETIDKIIQLLTQLLPSTLSTISFASRWQILRTKLASLKSLLSEVSYFQHWSDNPLLHSLLPNILSTVYRAQTLCHQCCDPSFNPGKLLMQSDLDMASGWLSKQIHDLDLLLRSGVLHQSTAIVLPHPTANASKEDLSFFVKDLFTRLQIGGLEFKRKALDSLIQLLSEDEKSASVVAKEGNMRSLIQLLDLNSHDSLRELAVLIVSILVSMSDYSRKCLFEEGALGPLLRIIECSSMPMKEKAAMAVEFITADTDFNAWAISAYGVEEIRIALAEEGAVPALVQLLVTGTPSAQEKAANCIAILASSDVSHQILLGSTMFILELGELIKHGNIMLQHVSASLLAKLSISDDNKRAIGGCMGSLMKLMESSKPDGLQEVATNALVSLLSVKSNRKDLVRDEKCVMRLMLMLDPKNEVTSKKFPVAVVAAIMSGRSQSCRKTLMAAGAYGYMRILAEKEELEGVISKVTNPHRRKEVVCVFSNCQ